MFVLALEKGEKFWRKKILKKIIKQNLLQAVLPHRFLLNPEKKNITKKNIFKMFIFMGFSLFTQKSWHNCLQVLASSFFSTKSRKKSCWRKKKRRIPSIIRFSSLSLSRKKMDEILQTEALMMILPSLSTSSNRTLLFNCHRAAISDFISSPPPLPCQSC